MAKQILAWLEFVQRSQFTDSIFNLVKNCLYLLDATQAAREKLLLRQSIVMDARGLSAVGIGRAACLIVLASLASHIGQTQLFKAFAIAVVVRLIIQRLIIDGRVNR